jgi:hypothetical protein
VRNASSKFLAIQIFTTLLAVSMAGPAAAGEASGALQRGWRESWRSGWRTAQNWNGGARSNRGYGAVSGGTVLNLYPPTSDSGASCLQTQPEYAVDGTYLGQQIVDVCRRTGVPW